MRKKKKKKKDKRGQMALSEISIKILGIHFGNSALDNSDWDK